MLSAPTRSGPAKLGSDRRAAVVAAVVAIIAGAALAAGCARSEHDHRAARVPTAGQQPTPLVDRVAQSGTVPRVRAADLRAPIAAYRRHVRRALQGMLADIARLDTAVRIGDRAGARAAWLAADERYEEIGAAYGAFGTLDVAINGRDGALHRVERALWAGSMAAAARSVPTLHRTVRRLRARLATLAIDPLEYTLRAHEVLEDTLHLRLTGQTSPWSGAALVALRGNLRGTRVVLATVRPLLLRRDPAVVVASQRALGRLGQALRQVTAGRSAAPRWDRLPLRERERLAGLTAAAAERLAYVPDLLDPRPPRRPQAAFGAGARR